MKNCLKIHPIKCREAAILPKAKLFNRVNNSEKAITLIEIMVVIAIITLFSMILIADYPKIKRQFALSRAVYKFAQDLRKTQDLGLSGVQIKNEAGNIVNAKGYGIYINRFDDDKGYIIYADRGDTPNYKYDNGSSQLCSLNPGPGLDCILEIIDISKEEPGVFISGINNISGSRTSINFNPPNPDTRIEGLVSENNVEVVFALSVDPFITRAVSINTSGLIEVK